jgi:hypothetical protein
MFVRAGVATPLWFGVAQTIKDGTGGGNGIDENRRRVGLELRGRTG